MLSQVPQKCFYYFETDHLFLFCPTKTEDKKKDTFLSIKKIYASIDSSYNRRRHRTWELWRFRLETRN